MKVKINKDEWYPVFVADPEETHGRDAEMTEEEWMEYKRVDAEFSAWQGKLSQMIKRD